MTGLSGEGQTISDSPKPLTKPRSCKISLANVGPKSESSFL
jgi:hypothetical protein